MGTYKLLYVSCFLLVFTEALFSEGLHETNPSLPNGSIERGNSAILPQAPYGDLKAAFPNTFYDLESASKSALTKGKLLRQYFTSGDQPNSEMAPLSVPSEPGSYIPSAGSAGATVLGADLFSLDCDVDHVILGVHSPHGTFGITKADENPSLEKAFISSEKPVRGRDFCRIVINPRKLEMFNDVDNYRLPVLQKDGIAWFPQSICLADASGNCAPLPTAFLELSGKNTFFSDLALKRDWKKQLHGKFLMITYGKVKDNEKMYRYLSDSRREKLDGMHPGDNPVLQQIINEELVSAVHRGNSDMLKFIDSTGLADCDMTALAYAQWDRNDGHDGKIIDGNMPLTPRLLDSQTRNHAWNLVLYPKGGKRSGFSVYDNTFNPQPNLEYFATPETARFLKQRHFDGRMLPASSYEWAGGPLSTKAADLKKTPREDVIREALAKTPMGDISKEPVIAKFNIVNRSGSFGPDDHFVENGQTFHDKLLLRNGAKRNFIGYDRRDNPIYSYEPQNLVVDAPSKARSQPYEWVDFKTSNAVRLKGTKLSACLLTEMKALQNEVPDEACVYTTGGPPRSIALYDNEENLVFSHAHWTNGIDKKPKPTDQELSSVMGNEFILSPGVASFELRAHCKSGDKEVTKIRRYSREGLMNVCEANGGKFEPVTIVSGTVIQN